MLRGNTSALTESQVGRMFTVQHKQKETDIYSDRFSDWPTEDLGAEKTPSRLLYIFEISNRPRK